MDTTVTQLFLAIYYLLQFLLITSFLVWLFFLPLFRKDFSSFIHSLENFFLPFIFYNASVFFSLPRYFLFRLASLIPRQSYISYPFSIYLFPFSFLVPFGFAERSFETARYKPFCYTFKSAEIRKGPTFWAFLNTVSSALYIYGIMSASSTVICIRVRWIQMQKIIAPGMGPDICISIYRSKIFSSLYPT